MSEKNDMAKPHFSKPSTSLRHMLSLDFEREEGFLSAQLCDCPGIEGRVQVLNERHCSQG